MNELIVLGNIYDERNINCSNGRVYDGGGISPCIGATHFGQERYALVEYRYGIVCSNATQVSEDFSLSDTSVFKCLKANTHDIGVVEKICRKKYGQ